MRPLFLLHGLLLLGLCVPAPAATQGLGDAAAREREKRKQETKPKPAKVFTDTDLQRMKPEEDVADSAGEGESAAGERAARTAAKPGGKEEDAELDPLERERQERKLQEAEWRVRFANAREQVALAEAACWREVIRTEFYAGVPVQMKVKEFVETEEYRQAKRALADLEEQFRRTGLPAGWAREN
jgi:hypothetical protein